MAPTPRSRGRKRKAEDDLEDDSPSGLSGLESAPPQPKAKIAKVVGVDLADNTIRSLEPAKTLHDIKDWFDRRNNIRTRERDLRAALTDASRLVARFNLRQLSRMVQAQDDDARLELAGQSTVRVRKLRNQCNAKCTDVYPWVDTLRLEMATLFDCGSKIPNHKSSGCEIEFFGLVVNAVTAGFAFQLAFNLIMRWSKHTKAASRAEPQRASVKMLEEFVRDTRDNKPATAVPGNGARSKQIADAGIRLCGWNSSDELALFRQYAGETVMACTGRQFVQTCQQSRKHARMDEELTSQHEYTRTRLVTE